jgi:hypothetical protein
MDKMRSRATDDKEEERLVDQEIDGDVDRRLAIDVVTERDAKRTRALEGMQKRVPFYVDISKQQLHSNPSDNSNADHSDRPEYDVYNINNIATSDVRGGVGDWKKAIGREEDDIVKGNLTDLPGLTASEKDLLGGLSGHGKLILSPTSGRELLSTNDQSGLNVIPSWKITENVPRFSISKPIAPSELDFADIDPHKFKKVVS